MSIEKTQVITLDAALTSFKNALKIWEPWAYAMVKSCTDSLATKALPTSFNYSGGVFSAHTWRSSPGTLWQELQSNLRKSLYFVPSEKSEVWGWESSSGERRGGFPIWLTFAEAPFTQQKFEVKAFQDLFVIELRRLALGQTKSRRTGLWKSGDVINRMKIRVPHE